MWLDGLVRRDAMSEILAAMSEGALESLEACAALVGVVTGPDTTQWRPAGGTLAGLDALLPDCLSHVPTEFSAEVVKRIRVWSDRRSLEAQHPALAAWLPDECQAAMIAPLPTCFGEGVWMVGFRDTRAALISNPVLRETMVMLAAHTLERVRRREEDLHPTRMPQREEELVTTVVHELHAPLLMLTAEWLQLGRMAEAVVPANSFSTGVRESVARSLRATGALEGLLAQLANQIRGQGREDSLCREPLDLVRVTQEVIAERPPSRSDAPVRVALMSNGPVEGSWDKARLKRALHHLLDGAAGLGTDAPLSVSVEQKDRTAWLSIERVSARGIRPRKRVDARRREPGIDLQLGRTIVERHAGSVRWMSSPEEHRLLEMQLPCCEREQPAGRH